MAMTLSFLCKQYVNNLIEPRQQHEDYFAYVIRIQKFNNIKVWVYTPCGESKKELFKPVNDFNKDMILVKDVRILVWANRLTEHRALIKTRETLIEEPKESQHKVFYFQRCTYWINSRIEYNKHDCSHSFKPEIVCPKKKHITFLNEHKRQNLKNVITADIEGCVVSVTTNSNKYIIAEHILTSVVYIWQINFKYYFGIDCIKRFANDLLEIEIENIFKRNEKMVFNEDKLYQETNNTCHIYRRTCINKVRDHCHETGI